MRFPDCYKNIIYDICSMDGVWTGKHAKWFEVCRMSDEGNTLRRADYTTWKFLPQQADMMLAGSVDPASWAHCYCLPGLTTNCQYSTTGAAGRENFFPQVGAVEKFATGFYQRLWDYVDEHYDEEQRKIDIWPLNGKSLFPDLPELPHLW